MTQSKRFLTVGSFLRPEPLLAYKRQIEVRDDIKYPFYDDLPGYLECENESVKEIVSQQIEADLPEITDGEFARSLWHLDFVWGLKGVRRYIADHGYFFEGDQKSQEYNYETRKDIGIEITFPLSGQDHPFIQHFKRTKDLAKEQAVVKLTIPSPSHVYGELSLNPATYLKAYPDQSSFRNGLAQAYREFLKEYREVGGTIIQFDDCLWGMFAEDNPNSFLNRDELSQTDIEAIAQSFVDLNNEIIAAAHDLDLKVYTHNCRGNYASRNAGAGSYTEVSNFFLKRQNYDRFFLEWDDERAGDLSALEAFRDKPETEVVLGFLSSKTSGLENEAAILDQLQEACQYIPKDRLYLSHQCGFASCDGGNELNQDQEWAKIKQGQEIAYKFWGE